MTASNIEFFYGDSGYIDPDDLTPACSSALDQIAFAYGGAAELGSPALLADAMRAVGASPDVVAAGARWAEVRYAHAAEHDALVARWNVEQFTTDDPEYRAMAAVFDEPGYVRDRAALSAVDELCPISPRSAGTAVASTAPQTAPVTVASTAPT